MECGDSAIGICFNSNVCYMMMMDENAFGKKAGTFDRAKNKKLEKIRGKFI